MGEFLVVAEAAASEVELGQVATQLDHQGGLFGEALEQLDLPRGEHARPAIHDAERAQHVPPRAFNGAPA